MSGEVPSDVPPAAFGRFRVLHQIGVGGLGPVFRGEDPETRQPVVIKHLHLKLPPQKANQVVDGLRELVGRLPAHPALIRVVDAGLHHINPYIVTALATGESLDVALREYGPAVIHDALPRLERLADALDRAGSAGVWHGALQPRDILVSGQETQMTGIGIVPILEKAGVLRPARRPYGAPEVVEGGPTSPRADQYALGAIAYEWLFGGRAPRSAESVLDAPALVGVNAEALASALMTALAPDPAARFANCTRFVKAIRAAVNKGVPTATADEKPAAPAPVPLPLDSSEPAGSGAILPDAPVVEVEPPAFALDDLEIDSGPLDPPLQLTPRPEPEDIRAALRPERVAWQGSLGAPTDASGQGSQTGFSTGTVLAALLAGIALGGVGGYWIGASQPPPTESSAPAVTAEQPTAAPSPTPGREFTDAPVASGPGDAAKTQQPVTPAPVATPETAQLLVRSTPGGASVAVDGIPRGTTPLTVRDLALGTRTLVISRAGYASVERSISLTSDRRSRSVEIQLTPLARPTRTARDASPPVTTASLIVDSRPRGASVVIDGKPSGVTPLTVESIATGRHTVRLELTGYRPLTQTIEIKAGERRRVAASLEGGQEEE